MLFVNDASVGVKLSTTGSYFSCIIYLKIKFGITNKTVLLNHPVQTMMDRDGLFFAENYHRSNRETITHRWRLYFKYFQSTSGKQLYKTDFLHNSYNIKSTYCFNRVRRNGEVCTSVTVTFFSALINRTRVL